MDDLWTIFRSGMWRLWYKLSKEGKKRFYDEFLPLLHDTKHHVMAERDDDSYYLVYLGSKKSARGKGYANKLIAHMLEKVKNPHFFNHFHLTSPSLPFQIYLPSTFAGYLQLCSVGTVFS